MAATGAASAIGIESNLGVLPGSRSLALDSAKFFLVALVPICHLLENGKGSSEVAAAAFRWILLFNMPAFALVSGAVTSMRSCSLPRITTTLILPYLFFQTLYSLSHAWLFHTGHWFPGYVTPYWILWYLVSLACWRLATPVFLHLRWPLAIAVILALAAGCFDDIGSALSLSRTLVFFPFFLWGQRLGPARIESITRARGSALAAVLMLALAAAAAWHWRTINPAWLFNAVSYRTLSASDAAGVARRMWILAGAAGCSIAAIILAGRAAAWFRGWPSRAGRRCMAPYILHGFVIQAAMAAGGFVWMVAHVPARWLFPLCVVLGLSMAVVLSARWVSRAVAPLLEPRWLARLLFAQPPFSVEDTQAASASSRGTSD